ncbi:MAG TPA: recombinase RecT [Bryobacteraceae bacterium]|nr:recombinase RecT [Bryobacteraceae bacterium]
MNQLAKQNAAEAVNENPVSVRLKQMHGEFTNALPAHISADKFIRTIKTAVNLEPKLYKAVQTDGGMRSFLAACTKAASDGLILDGKEAVLLTFNTKVSKNPDRWEERVQYIPMRDGLLKLARNSGEISTIQVELVYEKDGFSYDAGSGSPPHHEASWFSNDRGAVVGGYAVGRLKDGSSVTEIMTARQILRIGAKTKNADQYDPAKGASWEEWWRKTLIRRIAKYLPKSSDREGQRFADAATRIDDLYDGEANVAEDAPALPAPPRKKRGAAASAIKDITPKPDDDIPPHDPETGELEEELDTDPI